MKNYLATATLVAMAVAMSTSAAWSADTATDAAVLKLQSPSIPVMRKSIANAVGYELKSVEIQHTAHQLTATIVNSKQNSSTAVDRETESTAISGEMERGMAGKAEFEGVMSIHIDYISRVGKKVKTIDKFDFMRSPANSFVLHKS
jgi:hypothetical protein